MPDDDGAATEATLELTLLDAAGLRRPNSSASSTFLSNPKPFAVAWIDPAFKKSAKTLCSTCKFHFSLSGETLRNPWSTLTIQIFFSRLLSFRGAAKLEGSACLPLSSLPATAGGGTTLTLPLRRQSGRPGGWVRVSVRMLWCLGTPVEVESTPTVVCAEGIPAVATGMLLTESRQMTLLQVEPNAPPMPEENAFLLAPNRVATSEGTEIGLLGQETNAPLPMSEDNGPPEVDDGKVILLGTERNVTPIPERKERGALKSFILGLVSGAVAAVVVGATALSEG